MLWAKRVMGDLRVASLVAILSSVPASVAGGVAESPQKPPFAPKAIGIWDRWIIVQSPNYSFLWDFSGIGAGNEPELPVGAFHDRPTGKTFLWFGTDNLHHALAELTDLIDLDTGDLVNRDSRLWRLWSENSLGRDGGWWVSLTEDFLMLMPPAVDIGDSEDPPSDDCQPPRLVGPEDGRPVNWEEFDELQMRIIAWLANGCCTGGCCGCAGCCNGQCCQRGGCCAGRCCGAPYCCNGRCCAGPCCPNESSGQGCCAAGQICCAAQYCCDAGEICCPGDPDQCCSPGKSCCGGAACCSDNGAHCCGDHCCPTGQDCTPTSCCPPDEPDGTHYAPCPGRGPVLPRGNNVLRTGPVLRRGVAGMPRRPRAARYAAVLRGRADPVRRRML